MIIPLVLSIKESISEHFDGDYYYYYYYYYYYFYYYYYYFYYYYYYYGECL